MNRIISTSDGLFMDVCGPSCCGKTELIFQMFLRNTFNPKFKSIYYFYQHKQPKFSCIVRNLNIFFTKFSGFDFISQLENCLLVFDDSCEEIYNDKEFPKLATAGRHRNISVIYVKHNLFQQSKWSRTIDLDTTHIILFKSTRDIQQITYIGKQLKNTSYFKRKLRISNKITFWTLTHRLGSKNFRLLAFLFKYCTTSSNNFLSTFLQSGYN